MLNQKDYKKNNLEIDIFLATENGIYNYLKGKNIKFNLRPFSNPQHSKNKKTDTTNSNLIDLHLEIVKKIDNLLADNEKNIDIKPSNIPKERLEFPSVEIRDVSQKKPEMPSFKTEIELENVTDQLIKNEDLGKTKLTTLLESDLLQNNDKRPHSLMIEDDKSSQKLATSFAKVKVRKESKETKPKKTQPASKNKKTITKNNNHVAKTKKELEKTKLEIEKKKQELEEAEKQAKKKEEELKIKQKEKREKEKREEKLKEIKAREKEKEAEKRVLIEKREKKLQEKEELKEAKIKEKELKIKQKEREKEKKLKAKEQLKAEKLAKIEEEKKAKEAKIKEKELKIKQKEREKEKKLKAKEQLKAEKLAKIEEEKLKEKAAKKREIKPKKPVTEKKSGVFFSKKDDKKIKDKKLKKKEKKLEKKKLKAKKEKVVKEKTFDSKKEMDDLILKEKILDNDVKKLLPIIDNLLEKLPDEVIDEFAQSDDFELYEKVVTKYKNK